MKNIISYNEFLNEELNLRKTLGGAALGAGLLFGSPASSVPIPKPGMEQTITQEEKIDVDTRIAVSNLIKCDYKYDGYDLNSDGNTTIYFNKKNVSVVLNCITKKKWNGKDSFVKFIIKNSILR